VQYLLISQLTSISEGPSPIRHMGTHMVACRSAPPDILISILSLRPKCVLLGCGAKHYCQEALTLTNMFTCFVNVAVVVVVVVVKNMSRDKVKVSLGLKCVRYMSD